MLRDDADDTAGPPQPTLGQLPAFIEESGAAGMTLLADIDVPDGESLPAAPRRTAYRIIQEGLTNARKHAPGAPVTVTVTVTDTGRPGLLVEIISRGPVRIPAQGAPPPSRPTPSGTGVGLIGLAERVALAGGTLEHETNGAGDFILRAILPVAS